MPEDAYQAMPGVEGNLSREGVMSEQVFFEQPFVTPEWDAAMWEGWDLGLLNEADVQMEWDGLGS